MIFTVPNWLTFGRIAAVPVLLGLAFVPGVWASWIAMALFAVASITDWVDGYVARRLNQTSDLGKMLDPIADKLLVGVAILLLIAGDLLDGWALIPAAVIIVRELFISGLREFLAGRSLEGLPVSPLAKWKTTVQMSALTVLLGVPGLQASTTLPWEEIGVALFWAAAGLTALTAWSYARIGIGRIVRLDRGGRPEASSAAD